MDPGTAPEQPATRATPWFLVAALELLALLVGAALVFWVMR